MLSFATASCLDDSDTPSSNVVEQAHHVVVISATTTNTKHQTPNTEQRTADEQHSNADETDLEVVHKVHTVSTQYSTFRSFEFGKVNKSGTVN